MSVTPWTGNLKLSTRARNCLSNWDYRTVEQIELATDHDLMKIRSFGRKTLREVRAEVNRWRAEHLKATGENMTYAIDLIAGERGKQITKWGSDHDDSHTDGSLAVVAATIAVAGTDAKVVDPLERGDWGLLNKHPDRLRQLTIAGALIAAELDREIRYEIRKRALQSKGPT